MRLDMAYEPGNKLGPGWTLTMHLKGKIAAMFYSHEPTAKNVVDFVNQLGTQIEAIYAAN